MSSTAEKLADEYAEGKDIDTGSVGKRPKADQAGHKRESFCWSFHHMLISDNDGDNTRKIVDNAQKGEEKRKQQQLKK